MSYLNRTCLIAVLAACGAKIPGTGSGAGPLGTTSKLEAHPGGADGVVISADGKLAASGGEDGSAVKLWNVGDRKAAGTLEGHTGPVHGLAFSPDGKTLVTGDHYKIVKVWDVASRKEKRSFEINGPITQAAFAPDGSRFYLASRNSAIYMVAGDAEPVELKHEFEVVDLAISADSKLAVAIDGAGTAIIYDASGAPGVKVSHATSASAVAFAQGGGFYTGGGDAGVRRWDAAGKPVAEFKCESAMVTALRVTADGKRVVIGTQDGKVLLVDAATCKLEKTIDAHERPIVDLSIASDGTVATAGMEGAIGFWSID